MLIYNGQITAGGGTIVLSMTRAEYEANKDILDSADVWVDLTDEPDQVATADQIAYSVDGVQKGMGYIGDIATKAVAKVEPTDTALYLHEVGEYFINKDGDACKVDLQIPVDGTITLGTNCHVLSKGVANDINSNLSDINNYTLIRTITAEESPITIPSSEMSQYKNVALCYNYFTGGLTRTIDSVQLNFSLFEAIQVINPYDTSKMAYFTHNFDHSATLTQSGLTSDSRVNVYGYN